MRVYPTPFTVGETEGFTPEKDLFGRADLGKGMANLVSVVEDPLVIAFDGQWGSGKTTFLKMWAGELRKNGHPVIFFDAFENDYVEDAFAALARELIELAEERSPKSSKAVQTIREKATDLGALLLRGATKLGVKAGTRALTAGMVSADDFEGLADDIAAEAEGVAEAYMEKLLDAPRAQKGVVEAFRNALSNLPILLAPPAEGEQQKPLIFIIDELDRCKPLFALSLLERIKHFLSVPNVHFILGVHLQQLEASVRYAYGDAINASSYLQKFINLTILNVEDVEHKDHTDLHKYARHLEKSLSIRRGRESPLEASTETIIRLIEYEQMGFRTLERAYTSLALAIGLTPENHLQHGAIMGGLIMMKLLRPELYKKAKQGRLQLDEARGFLRFPPEDGGGMGWEEKWWTYFLGEPLPADLSDFGRSLSFTYRFRDRRDVIKYTANKVIDQLLPA